MPMTQEQYDRWQDFARRMVPIAVSARKRAPSRADTLEIIEFFFKCRMEPDEWQRVVNWDHTEASENEKVHGRPWPSLDVLAERRTEWDVRGDGG